MAQSISDTMGCLIWQELSHLRQSGHQTIDPWLQQLTQHMAKDPQHLNCMSKLLGLSISSPVDTFSWCMLADIGFPRFFPWVFPGFPLFFLGFSQVLHDFSMGFPWFPKFSMVFFHGFSISFSRKARCGKDHRAQDAAQQILEELQAVKTRLEELEVVVPDVQLALKIGDVTIQRYPKYSFFTIISWEFFFCDSM